MKVVKGSKIIKQAAPYYVELSNAYTHLEEFSADSGPTNNENNINTKIGEAKQASNFKAKAAARRKTRKQQYSADMNDNEIINMWISKTEDERTSRAKRNLRNKNHLDKTNVKPTMLERGLGLGHTVATAARRLFQ